MGEFSEFLKTFRKSNKITLRDLEAESGIGRDTISRFEREMNTPSSFQVTVLAGALQKLSKTPVSPYDLSEMLIRDASVGRPGQPGERSRTYWGNLSEMVAAQEEWLKTVPADGHANQLEKLHKKFPLPDWYHEEARKGCLVDVTAVNVYSTILNWDKQGELERPHWTWGELQLMDLFSFLCHPQQNNAPVLQEQEQERKLNGAASE